ncbi:MAG TPA: hypothetical protein VH161_08110, partial [Candidatus Acidoferrales bacterium]|nr:hypothetical protein [Candidatus Acidoferrales bacterium]
LRHFSEHVCCRLPGGWQRGKITSANITIYAVYRGARKIGDYLGLPGLMAHSKNMLLFVFAYEILCTLGML